MASNGPSERKRVGVSAAGTFSITTITTTICRAVMMKNLSEDDLRYLAGFFDGEGSVGLYHDRKDNRWRASVDITQNYSRWVEILFNRWAAEFDGRVYFTQRKTIKLLVRGKGLIRFVRDVQRYTKLKTRQLIVLEQYLETKEFPFRSAQLLKTLKRST